MLNQLLLGALVWGMRRQEWAKSIKPFFFPALLFKMVCGVLLGWLYTYYYQGGDTTTYHYASLILSDYAVGNPVAYLRLLFLNEFESEAFRATIPFSSFPGFSNSFYFIKLLSVLNFLTFSSYYLNAFYISLFSFWGAGRLAAVLMQAPGKVPNAGVVAFLFFPSVVFWSAGLSKDALMFGSMCWVIAFALNIAHGRRVSFWQVLLLPVLLYIFVKIKLFFAAVTLPLLLLYILVKRGATVIPALRRPSSQLAIYGFAFASGLALVYMLQKFLPVAFLLEQSAHNYNALLERSLHGPHMVLENLEPTLKSMVEHFPEALLSAIYRPLIGEAWEPLYILIGLENLLLLLLTGMAAASLFKNTGIKIELLHLLLFLLVLLLGGMVGLTTPNFGSLSRYRIVFLPFLVYLLLQNRFAQRLLRRVGL